MTNPCIIQKQPSQKPHAALVRRASASTSSPIPKPGGQRGSLPSDIQPPLDFQWPPPIPVSMHTSNLRLTMMNQDPKDLHTARLIIEELRTKVRCQSEHIMKWRRAYAMQIQQHYRYQKEKGDQMNSLTSQLLLLESRLKRKQKQISSLLSHRELTIHRQQKIIDALSSRLVDHGLETIETNYATELDSLNDSDSAVVLEDIDSDCPVERITLSSRRKGSLSGSTVCVGSGMGGDGITIVRSISDAIDSNVNKYSVVRRNNCFLRRPDILETVYSVEEDPEPTSDVAEKRDKFRNRSEKALSSSSTEGQIDTVSTSSTSASNHNHNSINNLSATTTLAVVVEDLGMSPEKPKEMANVNGLISLSYRQMSSPTPLHYHIGSPPKQIAPPYSMNVPHLHTTAASMEDIESAPVTSPERAAVKSQVTNFNRVMSNHRSVTKPKDVKYKRINKAKSKSLEELRGRLKNLVERGIEVPGGGGGGGSYAPNVIPQTAQSYA